MPQCDLDAIRKSVCVQIVAIKTKYPEIKSLGLCHSVQGTAEMLAQDLGEDINDIDYICSGINHMAFYQKFNKKNTGRPISQTKKISRRHFK